MSNRAHPSEVYLDYNASAPLAPEARAAMDATWALGAGNPMSSHAAGRRLKRVLEDAREHVAALVGARPDEVVFTSGATEANALAVHGIGAAGSGARAALVTSRAEHPSVANAARRLAAAGREVRWAGVDRHGRVAAEEIAALAGDDTALVALVLAEPVLGTLQPVVAVGAALAGRPTALHVDAAQAAGRIAIELDTLGADALSLSGHKLGGPAGIGALVLRKGTAFLNPLADGAHELGRRPGTQAVALAAGFGAAARMAADVQGRTGSMRARVAQLREGVRGIVDATILTPEERSLPNTLAVAFAGCPGEAVLASLDARGVRVSTGSACTSGARVPPDVLMAGGWPRERAAEAVRISVGADTPPAAITTLLALLEEVLPRVRAALVTG